MPVYLNSKRPGNMDRSYGKPSVKNLEAPGEKLTIGLINNMPDGALEATERQFLSLLDAASDGFSIQLSLYSLPGISRNETGAEHIRNFYSSTESLCNTHLDGLIVTGREPLTANLADEPYWKDFTGIVDWAQNNTHSTIWSCLAAHAAILDMDGIARVKSDRKHSGVFDCRRVSDHPLIAGIPAQLRLPHSRWNGVREDELIAHGYSVLTRTASGDVDTFIRQGNSLFVFFQGHPEYESSTLMLEYRRDVIRYLREEINICPTMPHNYFDDDTAASLTALQNDLTVGRREDAQKDVTAILEQARIENTWHSTAECMYRNWLRHIGAQKKLRQKEHNGMREISRMHGSMLTLTAAGTSA